MMSTRGLIGIVWPEGKISTIYLGHDAQLESAGKILLHYYSTEQKVRLLLHKKYGVSSLAESVPDTHFYDDIEPGVEYYRFKNLSDLEYKTLDNLTYEHVYLFDVTTKSWVYMYRDEYRWRYINLKSAVEDIEDDNEKVDDRWDRMIRPEDPTVDDINFMYKRGNIKYDDLKAYDEMENESEHNEFDPDRIGSLNLFVLAGRLQDKYQQSWIIQSISVDFDRKQITTHYKSEHKTFFLDVKINSNLSLLEINCNDLFDLLYREVQRETEIGEDYNVYIDVVNGLPTIWVRPKFSEY